MAVAVLIPEIVPDYFSAENLATGEANRQVVELLSRGQEEDSRTSILRFKKTRAQRQIYALSFLDDGWDSYAAPRPNSAAIQRALRILDLLDGPDLMTVRILPSADGGVGICFVRGDRYADLECSNDGEVFGVRHIGKQAPTLMQTDASDVSIEAALQEIRDHIRG